MSYTLTDLLRDLGQQPIDGDARSRQEIVAAMAWDYVTSGEITFPSGHKLTATSREWISALKWLMAQLDGKPSREKAAEPRPAPQPIDFDDELNNFEPYPTVEHDHRAADSDRDDSYDRSGVWHEQTPSDGAMPEYARPTVIGLQPKLPYSPSDPNWTPPPADAYLPPSATRPPVQSVCSDGSVILIDRDADDRRRAEGFRNGSRYVIGGEPSRYPTRDG